MKNKIKTLLVLLTIFALSIVLSACDYTLTEKTEKADGKNISLPGNENTLRIKISNWLNEHGKRREGTQKKPYFQTADIADAAGVFYKEFEPVQYLREFEKIGIPAERIPKPKKK